MRSLNRVVQIDEGRLAAHLDEVIRSTVEETFNALLGAEADRLGGAQRYERNETRQDMRAGLYQWQWQTKAGGNDVCLFRHVFVQPLPQVSARTNHSCSPGLRASACEEYGSGKQADAAAESAFGEARCSSAGKP